MRPKRRCGWGASLRKGERAVGADLARNPEACGLVAFMGLAGGLIRRWRGILMRLRLVAGVIQIFSL